ncbi:flagellar hook-length control protein FliK [Caldicellulosiruptor morganii]|uniref:Flagellar hook-length control protein FliK n=1 Tax=Caldicellulosiruptor morganii TaxID=1387555 RepID=A0ABY7BM14_9FIRM|nr:flagellar hook-length control protein FliK [Caldicellulosiruptor morganii]WAM33448.1 flagellar hook-length control protein FliK [Caldicellulosiruptor morganii]
MDAGLIRIASAFFPAAASGKAEESFQNVRGTDRVSFRKVFDSASKKDTESSAPAETGNREKGGKNFAPVLNPEVRKMIAQSCKETDESSNPDIEMLQESSKAASEKEEVSNLMLQLILSLLQNRVGNTVEFEKQALNDKKTGASLPSERIEALLNLETAFDASAVTRALAEFLRSTKQVQSAPAEFEKSALLFAKLVFENADALGLGDERLYSVDTTANLKSSFFEHLKNIFLDAKNGNILASAVTKALAEFLRSTEQVQSAPAEFGNKALPFAKLVFENVDATANLKSSFFELLKNIFLDAKRDNILATGDEKLTDSKTAILEKLSEILSEHFGNSANLHTDVLNGLYESVAYAEDKSTSSSDHLQTLLQDLKESAKTDMKSLVQNMEKAGSKDSNDVKDSSDDVNDISGKVFSKFDINSLFKVEIKPDENAIKPLRVTVIDQIAEKILLSHKQNLTTLTVSIKPEWLGSVVIELNKDLSGNITGNIVVTNPQVKEVIESSLSNLLTILKDQGINISQLNVSLGNNSSGQKFQNQQRFFQKQNSIFDVHETDAYLIEDLIYEMSENVLNLRA